MKTNTERGKMSRIRLNQEYRNKIANRMKVHIEQEDTQEKEKFFQCRENLLKYVYQDNIRKLMLTWRIIFKTSIKM